MKRLLGLLFGLLAVAGVTAAPSAAFAYPPTPPTGNVSSGTVGTNGHVSFSGTAGPNEVITVTVTYSSGAPSQTETVTADGAGAWSIDIQLEHPGTATLSATGLSGTVTQTVLVQAASTGDGGLAVTGLAGGRLPQMLLSGFGAVLFGGLLVFAAVRWRRRTTG
jgi:hypothetical protein